MERKEKERDRREKRKINLKKGYLWIGEILLT